MNVQRFTLDDKFVGGRRVDTNAILGNDNIGGWSILYLRALVDISNQARWQQ